MKRKPWWNVPLKERRRVRQYEIPDIFPHRLIHEYEFVPKWITNRFRAPRS